MSASQRIKNSEAADARKRLWFTSVDSGTGFPQTRLSGALTFTIRVVKADGTSVVGGGSVIQPDATNAPGMRYYIPSAGDLSVDGATGVRISATGMETRELAFCVTSQDDYDAVRGGLSSLPNAEAGNVSQGGLPRLNALGGSGFLLVNASGYIRSATAVMETDVITAAALAADAVTEIQAGLATGASQTTIINATDTLEASMVTVNTKLDVIAGLMHKNGRVDNTTYSTSGFMTSARLRVFATSTACTNAVDGAADGADGETMRFLITSIEEGSAKVLSYRLIQVL